MHTHQPSRMEISGDAWQRKKLLGSEHATVWQETLSPTDLSFREGIIECIRDPQIDEDLLYDPPDRQLNDIHYFLSEALGCDDNRRLKFYPSLHCSADRKGVDFFITYTDPYTGKNAIVTVDLTIDPNKYLEQEDYKADVLFRPTDVRVCRGAYPGGLRVDVPDIDKQDKNEERETMEATNRQIAKMFATLIQHRLENGDLNNWSLFAHTAQFRDDVRRALGQIFAHHVPTPPALKPMRHMSPRVGPPRKGAGTLPRAFGKHIPMMR